MQKINSMERQLDAASAGIHDAVRHGKHTRVGRRIRAAAVAAVLCAAATFAQQASAGCLDVPKFKPTAYRNEAGSDFRFINAAYQDNWGPSFFQAPIVGLWSFTYFSKGNTAAPLNIPDGAPIDAGATTWFADGNEMTYSGVRNPIVGATCLGVWQRTGEYTYVLNHVGLSWNPQANDPSGAATLNNPGGGPGAPGGPAFIKQYVVLAKDGKSYSGTFTITNLAPDGKTPAGPVIKGLIKAMRITIDSDTWEPTP